MAGKADWPTNVMASRTGCSCSILFECKNIKTLPDFVSHKLVTNDTKCHKYKLVGHLEADKEGDPPEL